MDTLPEDYFVTSMAFTKSTHIDEYPAIDPSAPALSQAGKVIVVSGASSGIGQRGLAVSFAKTSPKALILVGRRIERLRETETLALKANPNVNVISIPTDTTNEESVKALFETIKVKFGHADVLINNAGVFTEENTWAESNTKAWWGDFQVNVLGTYLMTRYFLNLLGKERQGSIVILSSALAFSVLPRGSSYGLTKNVNLQMAEYIAVENPNVTAVALHPGVVKTDMTTPQFERFSHDTPALVGGTAAWLSSPAAKFLSGRYIHTNWDVKELEARKEEIIGENKLKLTLAGKLGQDQFQ
ncbi:MAG: hypothetical protein M1824_003054 [Vezdaea acicularis]|nr:MAG: hypothetical protein M1824_003054 [Vezdaea acicularis]